MSLDTVLISMWVAVVSLPYVGFVLPKRAARAERWGWLHALAVAVSLLVMFWAAVIWLLIRAFF